MTKIKTFEAKNGKKVTIVCQRRMKGYHRAPIERFKIKNNKLIFVVRPFQTVCRRFFHDLQEGDEIAVYADDAFLFGNVIEKRYKYDDAEKIIYLYIVVGKKREEKRWGVRVGERAISASTK